MGSAQNAETTACAAKRAPHRHFHTCHRGLLTVAIRGFDRHIPVHSCHRMLAPPHYTPPPPPRVLPTPPRRTTPRASPALRTYTRHPPTSPPHIAPLAALPSAHYPHLSPNLHCAPASACLIHSLTGLLPTCASPLYTHGCLLSAMHAFNGGRQGFLPPTFAPHPPPAATPSPTPLLAHTPTPTPTPPAAPPPPPPLPLPWLGKCFARTTRGAALYAGRTLRCACLAYRCHTRLAYTFAPQKTAATCHATSPYRPIVRVSTSGFAFP